MNTMMAIKYIWYKPEPNIWLRCKFISYSLGTFIVEAIYTGEVIKGRPSSIGNDYAIFQIGSSVIK